MFIRIQRSLAKQKNYDCIIDMQNGKIESLYDDQLKKHTLTYSSNISDSSTDLGYFNTADKAVKAIQYIYEQLVTKGSEICIVPEDDF